MTNGFIKILSTNIRRNFLRSFFSAIGIIVGIASLYFFITVGTGLNKFISGAEMQKLPMNTLRVRTTQLSLGLFRMGQPGFMKSSTISDSAIRKIRKIEGIKAIYPVMNVSFPISANISFSSILSGGSFRRRYRTDLIMAGAPRKLIADDLKIRSAFNGRSWPIPVLISRKILDIYNSAFAGSQKLPKISEKAILGLKFDLVLGQSTLIREIGKKTVTVPCKVVGFTEKSEMLGLVMPLEYVKRYNRRFIKGWNKPAYSSLYVKAKSSDKVAFIADKIEKMGFTVHAQKKVSNLIILVTFLFSLFSFIIIFVASVSIFNAFTVIVNQRRLEIGLYRSFGATRRFIKSLFLAEAAFIGAITGFVGLSLGVYLVKLTWRLVSDVLPPFLKSMDNIFPVSLSLLLLLIGGSLLVSILAAYIPATIAGRTEISKTLKE